MWSDDVNASIDVDFSQYNGRRFMFLFNSQASYSILHEFKHDIYTFCIFVIFFEYSMYFFFFNLNYIFITWFFFSCMVIIKGLELFWEQAPMVEEDDEKWKDFILENEALAKVMIYMNVLLSVWLSLFLVLYINVFDFLLIIMNN